MVLKVLNLIGYKGILHWAITRATLKDSLALHQMIDPDVKEAFFTIMEYVDWGRGGLRSDAFELDDTGEYAILPNIAEAAEYFDEYYGEK